MNLYKLSKLSDKRNISKPSKGKSRESWEDDLDYLVSGKGIGKNYNPKDPMYRSKMKYGNTRRNQAIDNLRYRLKYGESMRGEGGIGISHSEH